MRTRVTVSSVDLDNPPPGWELVVQKWAETKRELAEAKRRIEILVKERDDARTLAAQWQARLDNADTNLANARDGFTSMMNDFEYAQAKLRGKL